jgi:chemotaxis signal transduction protein
MRLAELCIDTIDVGIAAAAVLRALPMPATLAPLPRRGGALCGVVDHGGALVPVVDLARWIDAGTRADGPDARILILRDGARTLGLRVTAVGGLVDVAPDTVTRVHHDDDPDEVFHSVARSPETGRILNVLDVGRLAALAGAWSGGAPAAAPAAPAAGLAPGTRSYALLDAGPLQLGVPAGALAEVIPMPPREAIGNGAWCRWRGRNLAIVPLAALVSGPADDEARLLAVLEHAGLALGVPVRATLRLADFALPVDGAHGPTPIVYDEDGAEVRLVDVAALFARCPEAALSRPARAIAATAAAGKPNDVAYVVFEADGLAAIPIDVLDRVLPLAGPPGTTLRWNDRAIPVADLRRGGHAPDAGQVLVVRAGGRPVACVVARAHLMIPAGAGRLFRMGTVHFITTDDGHTQASYRVLDLSTYAWPVQSG